MAPEPPGRRIGKALRQVRVEHGSSPSELEEALGLSNGWVELFESGEESPPLDLLLAWINTIGTSIEEIVDRSNLDPKETLFERTLTAAEVDSGVLLEFPYGNFRAEHLIPGATIEEFDRIMSTLRDGLNRLRTPDDEDLSAFKTEAVAQCFLEATRAWPTVNPSDIWWFVVYRGFLDRFNHPAEFSRLSLDQSWKRTGGWALEEVLVRHYGPVLNQNGVRMFIASSAHKEELLGQLTVSDRIESDKADVLLTGVKNGTERCFGVVHVKTSFAERRTDDVPMSRTLIDGGYVSPLWTMDAKSMPSANPINKGELGPAAPRNMASRSAKRKDIEDDGYFSNCFSYNSRTEQTAASRTSVSKIIVCDFQYPDDQFSQYLVDEWNRLQPGL